MNEYEKLANAIIILAVDDYRRALKVLKEDSHDPFAKKEKRSIEKFFRSEYFGILTKVDPEVLIKKLRKEVDG